MVTSRAARVWAATSPAALRGLVLTAAIASVTAFALVVVRVFEEVLRGAVLTAAIANAILVVAGAPPAPCGRLGVADDQASTQLAHTKRTLQNMMDNHRFKPYTPTELDTLALVVKDLVENKENRYDEFGGMTWMFLKDMPCGHLVNWTDSMPTQAIDETSLLSHWCSIKVDAHDAAGVFGCHQGENRLLSLGVILKSEIEGIAHLVEKKDRPRTGLTSAVFAAFTTDVVVLKVSETRAVKLLYRTVDGEFAVQRVPIEDLACKLNEALHGSAD